MQTNANGRSVKDANGNNVLDRNISNINISQSVQSAPNQTQVVDLTGNLDSGNATGTVQPTSIKIYNNNGGAHSLALNFTKTANPIEYTITGTIDGKALTLAATPLTFNADGTVNTPTSLTLNAADLNTALGSQVFDQTTPKNIKINIADPKNLSNNSITSFGGSNTVTIKDQDGYQTGQLNNLSVDTEGKIWGSFSNGVSEVLGQSALAKFTNPNGLVKDGNNFFKSGPDSGFATKGTAGETFPSTSISGGALEQSNVDLTVEFTNMISTQRAFEAASRTITVTDQLLAETNQLKR